jgi:hypothetical protein
MARPRELSGLRPWRPLVALCGVALSLSACQEAAEGPTQPTGKPQYIPLEVRCSSGASLSCSVQRFGDGDLTARAEWFAIDVIWVGAADRRVSFASPGVPVPSERVQVYIAARVGTETRASSYSYELAPGTAPVPMALFSGYVFDGDTGFVGIAGVTIDLQEEGAAPRTATTDVNGRYAFTHVRVSTALTIRAARNGFESQTARHVGIMPAAEGPFPDSSTTVQHFRLRRP